MLLAELRVPARALRLLDDPAGQRAGQRPGWYQPVAVIPRPVKVTAPPVAVPGTETHTWPPPSDTGAPTIDLNVVPAVAGHLGTEQ